jgi:hypothetical protein
VRLFLSSQEKIYRKRKETIMQQWNNKTSVWHTASFFSKIRVDREHTQHGKYQTAGSTGGPW